MSSKKRKRYSAEFKSKVALEAIKGQETLSELSGRFSLHPSQITKWKRQLLDNVTAAFEGGGGERRDEVQEGALYEQIGRLKMELEWLKKKSAMLQ